MNDRQNDLLKRLTEAVKQMLAESDVDKRTARALLRDGLAEWHTLPSGVRVLRLIPIDTHIPAIKPPNVSLRPTSTGLRHCSSCHQNQPNDDAHWDLAKDRPAFGMFNFICRSCDGSKLPEAAAPIVPPASILPIRALVPELKEGDTTRIVVHYPRRGPLRWSKVVRLEAQVISAATNPKSLDDESIKHYLDQGYIVLEAQ